MSSALKKPSNFISIRPTGELKTDLDTETCILQEIQRIKWEFLSKLTFKM